MPFDKVILDSSFARHARYLNPAVMEKTLRKIIAKTEARMERYNTELEALHETWAKCFVEEPDSDDDSSSSDGCLAPICDHA